MTSALVMRPTAPFSQLPRSDTLFGAICWGIRRQRGESELEAMLERFSDGDPPFLISSGLPALGVGDDTPATLLCPKPRLPGPPVSGDELGQQRVDALQRWKSLEYIPLPVVRQLATADLSKSSIVDAFLDGDLIEEDSLRVSLDGEQYLTRGRTLLPEGWPASSETDTSGTAGVEGQPETPLPFRRQSHVRNAINRLTGSTDGQVFTVEQIRFHPDAGMAVLARGDVSLVAEGLAVLQDTGIGGNRSTGNGQFVFETVRDVEVPAPTATTEHACTLSLCIPTDTDREALSKSYYEPLTRKGIVEGGHSSQSNIWKRRTLALAEGSVLRTPSDDTTIGHNPIVADHFEHGVQQYGYGFPVAMTGV